MIAQVLRGEVYDIYIRNAVCYMVLYIAMLLFQKCVYLHTCGASILPYKTNYV